MAPRLTSTLSLGGFFHWWAEELAGLMPQWLWSRNLRSPPRVVVSIDKDGYRLITRRARRSAGGENADLGLRDLPELVSSLRRTAGPKSPITIGLRLPYRSVYARQVELPPATPTQTAQMLALDLERNSPFKVGDIWTAHVTQPELAGSGKQQIQHLIVKRTETAATMTNLAAQGVTVEWLDCWDAQGIAPLPINFLSSQFAQPSATARAKVQLGALLATALLLSASAAYVWIDRHETALASLKRDTAQLTVKAQTARDALAKSKLQFDDFTALQKLQDDYSSKTLVLNELTSLLPDTAWVSDLKIEGSNTELSGFAQSAADVVRLLERSRTFSDVSLASAVTFDQRNTQERFSLRLRLRGVPDAAIAKPKDAAE